MSEFDSSRKRCCECKQVLDADRFYKCSAKKDGLAAKCKDCDREYQREYRKKNPEYFRARGRKERTERPELNAARTKRWREKNAERKAAMNKAWREANREHVAETYKRWRERNLEQDLEAAKRWYRENKDRKAATNKRWRESNRETLRLAAAARRAGGVGFESVEDLWVALDAQGNECCYCGASMLDGFEIDHMTPVSRGGTNDRANLALSCVPCNRSKGTKTVEEFLAWQRLRGVF